jgi:hypothetical protein
MIDPASGLERVLSAEQAAWLRGALAEVEARPGALGKLFPQLPRRIGRQALRGGAVSGGGATVDLDAWRRCDAAACALLAAGKAGDEARVDLYLHGDLEERVMVLRSLAVAPIGAATVRLLEEVQRTNMVVHFEAAICDSDLAARAAGEPRLGIAGFNRLILKLAFLDLPLARVLRAASRANEELSRMLQGLATEREAAGRAVWSDTDRLIARAPTRGTIARLVGHLEHGDDRLRLSAAEGLAHLNRRELQPFLAERLEREPCAPIRAVLQRALS